MVAAVFNQTLLYPVGDPTAQVILPVSQIADTATTLGAVRDYAGGTRRAISIPGRRQSFRLTLRSPTRELLTTLDGWLSRVCVLRDPNGQVSWVLVRDLRRNDRANSPLGHYHSATLTLDPTSENAAV